MTLIQWALRVPVAVGAAAVGLFCAHVVYGLFLGAAFPWLHKLVVRKGRGAA